MPVYTLSREGLPFLEDREAVGHVKRIHLVLFKKYNPMDSVPSCSQFEQLLWRGQTTYRQWLLDIILVFQELVGRHQTKITTVRKERLGLEISQRIWEVNSICDKGPWAPSGDAPGLRAML